jgi:hypothetical protein
MGYYFDFQAEVVVKLFVAAFLLLSGVLVAVGANANQVTWTVNKTFPNNDTAVGSFVYDADTNTYSSINVVLTQSGTPSNLTVCSSTCSNSRFVFATSLANGNPAVDFILAGGVTLTNAGGTINSASGAYAGVCNGAGCANTISPSGSFNAAFTLTGTAQATTVASVTPTSGGAAGGDTITVTGTNFTGATAVSVGGTACASFSVVSQTSIICVTPAHVVGTASVLVTAPGGTNTANTLFTYTAPPTPPQPIPTLSEWAQIIMMLAMIATAGFYGWRMKQR